MRSITLILVILFGAFHVVWGQFSPPAEQIGSTAIKSDSNIIQGWAIDATIQRGWRDIAQPDSGLVNFGQIEDALGPAGDGRVISLGDNGAITLVFERPIMNNEGWDFVIFENGFSDTFLELAFVEVSTNGIQFVRFPASSLSDTSQQIGPFGAVDATKLNNLAGKYRANFGTPFDLEELIGQDSIDLNNINYVRIVDAIGTIDPGFAQRDAQNNIINDPYPTPFESGGFDLDAVGVINFSTISSANTFLEKDLLYYPNPVGAERYLFLEGELDNTRLSIYDGLGRMVHNQELSNLTKEDINLIGLPAGQYYIRLVDNLGFFTVPLVVID
ncbi:MAG: T9SS type A sorting domain-containing protein [Bacteroidota bacterium]